jgi:mannose-6-phosphate isomerase-like protein (cupin superfamily)
LQLVVMTLQPGEEIGSEVHEHIDQVLAFIDGLVRTRQDADRDEDDFSPPPPAQAQA